MVGLFFFFFFFFFRFFFIGIAVCKKNVSCISSFSFCIVSSVEVGFYIYHTLLGFA